MLRLIHYWIALAARHPQVESAFIKTSKNRRMTMRKMHHVAAACAISAIMLSGNVLAAAHSAQAPAAGATAPAAAPAAAPKKEETGKDIAFNRSKGNCLACHGMPTVPDAVSAGLYGPPLIAMSARYPSKAALRAQIWDATAKNPSSTMIPYGKHGVLTEAEIDKVTDFVYGL
jgi:sulfur-oxidizing protein SoxX